MKQQEVEAVGHSPDGHQLIPGWTPCSGIIDLQVARDDKHELKQMLSSLVLQQHELIISFRFMIKLLRLAELGKKEF